MTKFYGMIGFIETVESPEGSGVWIERPVEYPYHGDTVYENVMRSETANLHDEVRLNNRISVVMDAYASRNVHNMRYVKWLGAYWTVGTVEIKHPRLLFNLGKVYNGIKA